MSFYDPKIYNYYNLSNEDKNIFNAMFYMKKCVLNYKKYDLDAFGKGDDSIISKIEKEVANEVLDDVDKHLSNELIEFIVNRIDSYEDVEVCETNSYFFGLDIDEEGEFYE